MINNHYFKRTHQKNRKTNTTIHLNNLLSFKLLIKKLSKLFKFPSRDINLLGILNLKQNQSMAIRSGNLLNIITHRQIKLCELANLLIKPSIKTKLWVTIVPLHKNLILQGYNYQMVLSADNVFYAVQLNLLWACIVAPGHQDILIWTRLTCFVVLLVEVRLVLR